MVSLLLLFSLLIGACVGSFLNVVIYRYGTGLSIVSGRSQCPVCNTHLQWFELIPVVSFFIQKGSCRTCKAPISFQYPFVELLTAVLFALVFIRQYSLYPLYGAFDHGMLYSFLFVIFYDVIVSLLLVIALYDLRHKIIPNGLVYWFSGLSVAKLLLFSFGCIGVSPFMFPYIFDLFAPILLFLPFWFLWFISRGTWLVLETQN